MKTDDTQAPDGRDVNRLHGIPDIKVEMRPAPDQPGHHLLFVDGQQIVGFGSDTPKPPDDILIWYASAFVRLREGALSEGQLVTMTGLDRVTVREIDDLFNQAMTGLADALAARTITQADDPTVAELAAELGGPRDEETRATIRRIATRLRLEAEAQLQQDVKDITRANHEIDRQKIKIDAKYEARMARAWAYINLLEA